MSPPPKTRYYYDDNIFLEDSNDEGGALSEMDDDDNDDNNDNNSNGGKGHNGNIVDSFSGGGKHHKADLPIIHGNLHPKVVHDILEIANGIDKHVAMESIVNMHVDEDALLRFAKCAYYQANEELDDDDYDEVANEDGKKNGNVYGHNGDGNDLDEGGTMALQLVAIMMHPPFPVGMVD